MYEKFSKNKKCTSGFSLRNRHHTTTSELKATSFNDRSLRNKFNEFRAIVYSKNFDQIAITETWCNFKGRDFEFEYKINGYQLFHRDRINRVGGGVIVYVKDTLRVTEIEIENIDGVEITGVTVDTGSAKLTFVNVYRPPNTSPETDVLLYRELRKVSVGHIVIVGDFNCPNVNYDLLDADNEGRRLLEFLDDNFLLQLINYPTRANNILDLLILSHVNLVQNIEISEPIGNSDHNMIKFNINLENKIMSNSQTVPDLKNANSEAFRNCLTNVDWEDLLGGNAEEM